MASPSLPRSNFGTASLLERKNAIPPVDVGEAREAEVTVEEPGLVEGSDINIKLEEDGGVVVDLIRVWNVRGREISTKILRKYCRIRKCRRLLRT